MRIAGAATALTVIAALAVGCGPVVGGTPKPAPNLKPRPLTGPIVRQVPLDDVALGVSLAVDVALFVDFEAASGDDFPRHGQIAARQNDPVEGQPDVALADEVTRVFLIFDVSGKHTASGKEIPAELLLCFEMAQHGVTDRCRGRRKIGFIQSALQ